MCLSVSRQTWGVCLLSLFVGLVPFVSQSAPSLRNVSITSTMENTFTILSGGLGNGGGGAMTLRVNWGDGTGLEVYSYTNSATNFSVGHTYEDDSPTNTAVDLYTISLNLSNNTGQVSTNLGVPVQNVAPRLSLTVNSPIEIGAPATLRGLSIREFSVPTAGSSPYGITVGPEGNLWFTENAANRLARITTNGVITEFPLPAAARSPAGIASGPDNRLWFCAAGSQQIGAMTTNGVVTMYTIPRATNEPFKTPQFITRRGGAMWYTDLSYRIGRVTTAGAFTQYVYPAGINPIGITVGADNNIWFGAYFTDTVNLLRPDGTTNMYQLDALATPALMTRGPDDAVWFTQLGAGDAFPGKIGRITTNGVLTNFVVGTSGPFGICSGPDGAIWFTESRRGSNSIGRMTLDGRFARYGLARDSDVTEIVGGPDGGLWFTMPGRDRIGRIRFTTPGNVVLDGELNDPGNLDTHTVHINWGDGGAVETINLVAGIASFHVAHTYSGTQPNYVISVTASDDDTGISQAFAVVSVNAVRFTSITCFPSTDVRIKGVGANGRTITIESSTDFQNWSTVGTVNSVSNAFEFVHPNPPGPKRFYRSKLP